MLLLPLLLLINPIAAAAVGDAQPQIKRRRAQQLKTAKQKDKEWQKAQNRKDRNAVANAAAATKPNIQFPNNVVLLEAAARNDIVEVSIF